MESVRIVKSWMMWLCLGGLLFTAGLATAEETQKDPAVTEGNHFRVSYKSKVDPIPMSQIHSWVLHIATLDGKPVEKAAVSVSGGMPAHMHGLPTQPGVSEIGNGDYLVEGVKFSMTGLWEMWFDIKAGQVSDKVKFVLEF